MERVHQILAAGVLADENVDFWRQHWRHIASAKVSVKAKIVAYRALTDQRFININNISIEALYEMILADRAFVAELGLDKITVHDYRVCVIWIDDDAAALARYDQKVAEYNSLTNRYHRLRCGLDLWRMKIEAPRCMRFLMQDKIIRELLMREQMVSSMQQLAEELVQPTDALNRGPLLVYGQSVKLVGMCVRDEELVAAWLRAIRGWSDFRRGCMSAMFARKLHELATPEQRQTLRSRVRHALNKGASSDGCFELAWLLGLLGPFYPRGQKCFRSNNVKLFPALTFAIIVAMCDGYLEVARPKITEVQRRFFAIMMRLPMDLQALVSLRLWGQRSTVIQSDQFDRAFLAVI